MLRRVVRFLPSRFTVWHTFVRDGNYTFSQKRENQAGIRGVTVNPVITRFTVRR